MKPPIEFNRHDFISKTANGEYNTLVSVEWAAQIANRKLEELFKGAKLLYQSRYTAPWSWSVSADAGNEEHIATAILIGAKKTKCHRHEPVMVINTTVDNGIEMHWVSHNSGFEQQVKIQAMCKHCGVKLNPTFQEQL
jgi:hypothetical protein